MRFEEDTQVSALDSLEQNPIDPILTDYTADSKDMLIAFGGISGEIGVPVFEFFKLLSDFPVKKLFLRDLRQSWYQNGVPGFGQTIDEVAANIKAQIIQQQVTRVVMIGNSAGGFAALLFGWILGADEVLAFSPQTFISQKQRLLHADFRWHPQIASVHRISKTRKTYLDLRQVYSTEPIRTKAHIHYCTGHRLDRYHAQYMRRNSNVILHKYSHGGHLLVKSLRDSGRLKELIKESFP